jgi:hypothetical protein
MAANDIKFPGGVDVTGDLIVRGNISPAIERSSLLQYNAQVYQIPLTSAKVWDDAQTNLPGTAATDDLEINTGTWGTNVPSIQTGDLKAAGATTRYALFEVATPPEYVAGQTVTLRASAGMLTTVADTSATIDFEAYITDREGLVSGSDLVSTAATTINSLTFASSIDFTLTPTTIDPGQKILIRMAIAVNDAASGTAVIGSVGALELLLDTQG